MERSGERERNDEGVTLSDLEDINLVSPYAPYRENPNDQRPFVVKASGSDGRFTNSTQTDECSDRGEYAQNTFNVIAFKNLS